ncbi:MAG: sulfite exporter TauE/SafE family protein [Bacteroidales bacterium]|nr:sulfite exporter TauE/SafE family protein [Bacteroidales bacterium]MDT8374554.1 sulfite exporter TauE/SafE family protein [Bacteroidales bacterium]
MPDMEGSTIVLAGTAVTIGFIHTLIGPDHYLPFIVMGEARAWSIRKTMFITFLCGVGHVLSSVVVGFIGIAAGLSLSRLELFESFRGNIAAWLLIAFGLIYMLISLQRLYRKKRHVHQHHHTDGIIHEHEHDHFSGHSHIHIGDRKNMTPWILFLIFVLGPCEPLIPILMYPAAANNISGVILVSLLFSAVTIATMMAVVLAFRLGLSRINLKPLEQYVNVIAGATIAVSGLAIQLLGL